MCNSQSFRVYSIEEHFASVELAVYILKLTNKNLIINNNKQNINNYLIVVVSSSRFRREDVGLRAVFGLLTEFGRVVVE